MCYYNHIYNELLKYTQELEKTFLETDNIYIIEEMNVEYLHGIKKNSNLFPSFL